MVAGILMPLAGGLALFLFGMHVMSEGIEKAAGAKMRSILEFFTTNRFTGMLVGLFFTAVIQSSSACTALVVAFVNSNLMTLTQAVGVIFGSNIGTTVTSQLVSFNLSAYAPAISMVGVVCLLFIKKPFM
ncbi:MAG: Na/Pi symporter, partial [Lachnospiraceae bacterium]|nr:Na/Pi symporter [Lachnospiraceae bacterium]